MSRRYGAVDDYGDDYGGRIRNSLVIRSRRRSRQPGSAFVSNSRNIGKYRLNFVLQSALPCAILVSSKGELACRTRA
jgi:hypothetical protein